MTQNTSIYWKTPETAERARLMAEAEGISISKMLSNLVDGKYEQEYPEPPISAICPTCKQESTFVFMAYWHEQSDLYRCVLCRTALQKDTIIGNGHGEPVAPKKENEHE